MPADTTVPVSDEVWRELMLRKNRGDTFDDVLRRELGLDAERDGDAQDAERETEPHADAGPSADVERAIREWEPPADVEVNTQNARDALRVAVAWLREQDEPKRKAEIVAGAYADGPLSERIWWARAVRPGLQALDAVEVDGRKYALK